jgi:hypothetical protein
MAALRGIGAKLSENREKVTSALLLGSFVALAVRSSEQQRELDDLEARKASIRAANSAMSSAMWAWREELFALAAKPSPPITAARLRHIYGEEEPATKQQGGYLAAFPQRYASNSAKFRDFLSWFMLGPC